MNSETHNQERSTPRELAGIEQGLDALAQHERGTMPPGLADRIVLASGLSATTAVEVEPKRGGVIGRIGPRRAGLALAAVLALAAGLVVALRVGVPGGSSGDNVPGQAVLASDFEDWLALEEAGFFDTGAEASVDMLVEEAQAAVERLDENWSLVAYELFEDASS